QNAKGDLSIAIDQKNKADVGVGMEFYQVNLGNLSPRSGSNVNSFTQEKERSHISYVYYSHQLDLSEKFSLRGGFRFSLYQLSGPGKVNQYEEGKPRSASTFITTQEFGKGDAISRYHGFEPRFSVRYSINRKSSIKGSFDQTVQYIHLISNTSAISPIDLWKLSDPYLKPQIGQQVSGGYFRNIGKNNYDFSMEVFYKRMQNVVDYKDGAILLLNETLEADLLHGEGRSYGAEWMIEKKKGRLTGWIAYTLSRTERKIKGDYPEERINKGEYYPANYDKPHNLSITGSYQKTNRVSWGFNFVFASGRPITYPTSSYGYGGIRVVNFEYRNNERSPAYHRLDLSLEIKSKVKPGRKWNSAWVVSIYNVYARKNPYSIFFRSEYTVLAQSYRLAVIGTTVPSLSYTINF
ncbi:MAG TPA: TonB-dependent receptor, partial [Chryseolinea sp.]|nr:TonB-dependent receptor [Chryseolinea sp.]